jgi:ABC-type transporter Mla MlaB component
VSTRTLKAIALGLALLLVLWGASEVLSRRADTTRVDLRLPAVDAAAVDTAVIAHGADTVVLAKQASTAWTVNGHPASLSAVGELFHALSDSGAAPPELAAQSPSSFARMGVDSASGWWVRMQGGGRTLARFVVGRRGPSFDAAYVRLAGDPRVLLWHGRLSTIVERGVDDWRDKQVARVEPDSIAAVDVTRGRTHYTLSRRGKAAWALSGGEPVDSAAVTRYLEHLRSVTAAGFATPAQADSLRRARVARRLTVRAAGGRPLVTLAFDSTAGRYWVRGPAGGAGTVYRLDPWQVDQLTPPERSLAKK